jgi:hypothetical protein
VIGGDDEPSTPVNTRGRQARARVDRDDGSADTLDRAGELIGDS